MQQEIICQARETGVLQVWQQNGVKDRFPLWTFLELIHLVHTFFLEQALWRLVVKKVPAIMNSIASFFPLWLY